MRKITLLDIAKYANVSRTTASMVLNNKDISVSEETRNRILEAAKEFNYIPNSFARGLSTKKSYTIGFVIPDIENPFFAEMAKAIEIEAEKEGYSIILCNTFNSGKREEEYIRLLISKLVDGVILVASSKQNNSINMLKANEVPFVIVDRHIDDIEEDINGVFCDNEQGIKIGLDYLIKKECKNIAFIGSNKNEIISNSRLGYFCKIASKYNIFNQELIEEDEISLEGGIKATERLIDRNQKIDAIFYSSDVMAIGGIKFLIRKGFNIPKDINILGYDNIGICSFIEPELTSVAQPIYNMGKEAFVLLMDIAKNNNNTKKVINLKPYLVERKTVK
ncbi:transcriptional regulator, LacI family protein [Clostridium sartagoforme AAU1]|uniref:Transcriptional regulator, LacI family protein n=1 Tax=Clostridium sartagoforme AAU1 TaxID=1202534 RepID=R9BSQ5_9CLOT|nr:LacI family DNA-binding transcriptional regulator [Clostridium sartagoforme]EOR20042.1 transcriptional regulator, LacI family protein [Clostridium sartagoforme AAU1]